MADVITLALEAATEQGSAALLDGSRLLGERLVAMRGREREALMPAVAELLEEQQVARDAIARVVCGAGPGSFTSLRIAGAIAKGLAMALGIPLVPVSSLALLVASLDELAPGRYVAALDALRGEHYVELFDVDADLGFTPLGPTRRVATAALEQMAASEGARLVGHGGSVISRPRARGAARLASLVSATTPADLARWEPAYGRLAEAQVKWEAAHGRPLGVA
jgi:tRNA threonylcarbamoyladenosine biosynthesis protein TsaB